MLRTLTLVRPQDNFTTRETMMHTKNISKYLLCDVLQFHWYIVFHLYRASCSTTTQILNICHSIKGVGSGLQDYLYKDAN